MSLQERVKSIIDALKVTGYIKHSSEFAIAIGENGVRVTSKNTGYKAWIIADESARAISDQIRTIE